MSEAESTGPPLSHVKRVMLQLWEHYLAAKVVPLVKDASSTRREVTKIFAPKWVVMVWREAHGETAPMLGYALHASADDSFRVETEPETKPVEAE
jgi:hypothetical protein